MNALFISNLPSPTGAWLLGHRESFSGLGRGACVATVGQGEATVATTVASSDVQRRLL